MSKMSWAVLIGVILLVLLALGASLILPFWARGIGLGPGLMRPGIIGGFGFPFLIMRGLGMLLFWILVIAGIFLLLRALAHGTQTPGASVVTNESPLEILRRRYANGEINKEQFDEMRHTLEV